ncbi:Cof-type HAD-IIB family hydrolase [Bacillus massilinigeriensis]|uniref:Cof-type HAD-IIB family hydrolase n=1 Tax=Bacillus mediterraneensis TaxID=1805474 RepID=UPI0008F81246|nr:HAD family hydrolase [Bacillus mediterraneensis]
MKNYRMLFLDIDGTILRHDDTIEESTKEAIFIMKEKGIRSVLATGRPIHEIKEIGEELGISSYIGYNGALGIDEGTRVFASPMNEETVKELIAIIEERHNEAVLYTEDKNLFTDRESTLSKQFAQKFHLKKNKNLSLNDYSSILGMTIITTNGNGSQSFGKEGDLYFSQVNVEDMNHCYDVIRKNINKGTGIKCLIDRLGIDQSETIAFGDGMNDKEMLSFAGIGIAMGNSSPDLFKYADRRTTAVTDSGIYNGLKSLGLI